MKCSGHLLSDVSHSHYMLHVTTLRGKEIIAQTLCKTLAVLFNIDFTTLWTGHGVRSASLAQHLAPAQPEPAERSVSVL